ncbi:hypothetical protein S40285_09713, partial [Stachybotrys chlorohalonatus IBT 40285]
MPILTFALPFARQCDENWPTCTSCAKAGCPCSGPPADSDNESESAMQSGSDGLVACSNDGISGNENIRYMEGHGSSQLLSYFEYPTGSSYACVRFSSPRLHPTTAAERVASRLTAYLERESRFDISLVDYFRLLPARLGSSAALRDAVAYFCKGWSDTENASPSKCSIDPQPYGKALRSLQRALRDDEERLATETLAAVSVMYRAEVLFGGQPSLQSVTHAQGIYSLMKAKGPPNLNDDLDVCLAFEHQISVTNYLLYQDGDNLYTQQHWKDTLVQVSYDNTEISPALIDHYFFSLQIGGWPEVIRQVKYLTEEIIDPTERAFSALFLWEHFENHKMI